jgi:serine/threonine protein kinase
MIPTTIAGDRYEVESLLGRGGMGEIYLAHDTRLDRPVAIKLLARELAHDAQLHDRMRREALLAARLSHPNLVAMLDAGEQDGRPFLVMEYVPGETLATRLRREGPLPPSRVESIGGDLAAALTHIHQLGMVHRDVKPDNVFLTPTGTVKLGDFGIAKALEQPRVTEIGTILGTASYLAPELLIGGNATPASDVFALGVLLYESVSGELPRRGATMTDLSAADTRPLAAAAPGLPASLVQLIEGCLARDAPARPPASELAKQLRRAGSVIAPTRLQAPPTSTASMPADERGQGAWEPPSLHRQRRRWLLALAALLLAAAVALGVFLLVRGAGATPRQAPPSTPPTARGNPSLQARELARWLREHAADS